MPLRHRTRFAALACALLLLLVAPLAAHAITLDADEQAFITQINQYRQQNGLVTLKLSEKLDTTAVWMATDLATKNYFSHTDSLGRDPFQRMSYFGYSYNTYRGENLAAGNSGASATFQQWKDSPGHNANMLNANFRVMGIARVYNANSTYKWYWANEFGGYDDSGSTPTPTPAPTLTAPGVPGALTLAPQSTGGGLATWSAGSGGAPASYQIQVARQIFSGYYSTSTYTVQAPATGLTIAAPTRSTYYRVRVRATNSVGTSAYSNWVGATLTPAQ